MPRVIPMDDKPAGRIVDSAEYAVEQGIKRLAAQKRLKRMCQRGEAEAMPRGNPTLMMKYRIFSEPPPCEEEIPGIDNPSVQWPALSSFADLLQAEGERLLRAARVLRGEE